MLLSLLVGVLQLKLAILGCDPTKCSDEVKASMMAQATYIEQYVSAEMSKPAPVAQPAPADNPQVQQTQQVATQAKAPVKLEFVGKPTIRTVQRTRIRTPDMLIDRPEVPDIIVTGSDTTPEFFVETNIPSKVTVTVDNGTGAQASDQAEKTNHHFFGGSIGGMRYTYNIIARAGDQEVRYDVKVAYCPTEDPLPHPAPGNSTEQILTCDW